MVVISNYISLISRWRSNIISLILYYARAFSFRTAKLIFIGMSYGLLYEMNFNSSLCTLRASISLFLRYSTNYISSFTFYGAVPLGTYFYVSWFIIALSEPLK